MHAPLSPIREQNVVVMSGLSEFLSKPVLSGKAWTL